MNIACFKNNGVPYLQVQESYTKADGRRGRRSVRNVGPLARFDDGEPNYLERLRASFNFGTCLIESLNDLAAQQSAGSKVRIEFDRSQDSDCFLEPKNIGYLVLEELFRELGIYDVLTLHKSRAHVAYDLVGITEMLVYGRVLVPDSKLATWQDRGRYLFDVAASSELDDVYAALDEIHAKSDAIQRRMDAKIKTAIGRDGAVCYYDVTNYFFEIDRGDLDITDKDGNVIREGLRKTGVSKAKNRKPIVQMGLICDSKGLPVAYRLFPGNHIDQTTLRPTMKESIDKMGFKRVVVVADGGLNSDKNICHTLKSGGGYIFSKSPKKTDKATRAWMLQDDGYAWNKARTFKVKSKVRTRVVKDEDDKKHTITEKIVSYWSYAHYLEAIRENESFCKFLEEVTKHPDKLKDKQKKYQKFLTKTQADKDTGEVLDNTVEVYGLNEAKIAEYRAMMGYYTLITSEVDMGEREVIDHYSGLSRIEDAFRATKTDLEGRPVYVRTPDHINAHFCICFIALSMIRLIQLKVIEHLGKDPEKTKGWVTGLSAERIQRALLGFQADGLPGGYLRTTRIDDDLGLLLDSLGIECDFRIPTIEQLRQFKFSLRKAQLMCS
jgi:transposase